MRLVYLVLHRNNGYLHVYNFLQNNLNRFWPLATVHCIRRMFLRNVFSKFRNFFSMGFVACHITDSYISIALTFKLDMRSLNGNESSLDFHILLSTI